MKTKEILFTASAEFAGIRLRAITSQNGILNIIFNDLSELKDTNITTLHPDDPFMFNVFKELDGYFQCKRKVFSVPLDIRGTDFQKRVWNELLKIPYGETVSYKHIANKLGDEKNVRAVGGANGANPIPIIIPCHRVINADGSLGGYTGGLGIKEKLLKLEGSLTLELFD